jgi:hypothetical protein
MDASIVEQPGRPKLEAAIAAKMIRFDPDRVVTDLTQVELARGSRNDRDERERMHHLATGAFPARLLPRAHGGSLYRELRQIRE